MTETKDLLALYDHMETKLEELGIDFDEFIVLYKSFKSTLTTGLSAPPKKLEAIPPNPFPWAQHAGTGWS